MSKVVAFDKYYTHPDVAYKFIDLLNCFTELKNYKIIEPSAGNGSFLDALEDFHFGLEIIAYDIQPEDPRIIQADYLALNNLYDPNSITLGNPPFGDRCSLAVKFLNKALEESKLVAFILPISFRKYSVQNRINKDAKLFIDYKLEKDSFLLNGKPYDINACFQVWGKKSNIPEGDKLFHKENLRITEKPETFCDELYIARYNGVENQRKLADLPFDLAMTAQGFCDYNKFYETEEEKEFIRNEIRSRKKQYYLVIFKNDKAREKFKKIDFNKASKENVVAQPGISKSQIIRLFKEIR
jgi:predicted RNA methylase